MATFIPDKFLTIEEYELVLSSISNPTHRLQCLLMGDSGLRVTEVCTLRWSDIDVKKKVVRVDSLKSRDKEKIRKLPMSSRLYDALVDYVQKKGREGMYLFGGDKPISRGAVNKWMKELSLRHPEIPADLHPHMLRHTFATNLRVNGAEIEDIQNALGHERVDTTMIYAHADLEQLRQRIEMSTPRPSFWASLRSTLFPTTPTRLNLPAAITPDLVGRDSEVKQIERLIAQGTSVVVVGPIGVGKSFLIDSLSFNRPVLELDDTRNLKQSLANCLIHLLGSKEAAAALIYKTSDRDALQVKVSKESVPNLCKLLTDVTERKEYVLKIGQVDDVTPSAVKALELLKDHFVLLTTSRTVKMSAASFLWNFEKVELKPLARVDSLRLFHRLTHDLPMKGTEWIQNKVFDTSEGNPRMIVELAERIRSEEYVDAYVVDGLCNNYLGRQTREIDISPLLLLGFGGLIIFKYLGREAGEQGITFIGSAVMVVALFARYFLRVGKRKSL